MEDAEWTTDERREEVPKLCRSWKFSTCFKKGKTDRNLILSFLLLPKDEQKTETTKRTDF
jgi:hypothetical protein